MQIQNKKGLIIISLPIILLLILVLNKSLNSNNNFSLDARQVLEVSVNQKHIFSINQLKEKLKVSNNVMLVDLRNSNDFSKKHIKNAFNIPFESILGSRQFSESNKSGRDMVLYSASVAQTTKSWTLLTQKGFKNLYILEITENLIMENILETDTIVESSEVLKYKFRPDSITRPE